MQFGLATTERGPRSPRLQRGRCGPEGEDLLSGQEWGQLIDTCCIPRSVGQPALAPGSLRGWGARTRRLFAGPPDCPPGPSGRSPVASGETAEFLSQAACPAPAVSRELLPAEHTSQHPGRMSVSTLGVRPSCRPCRHTRPRVPVCTLQTQGHTCCVHPTPFYFIYFILF